MKPLKHFREKLKSAKSKVKDIKEKLPHVELKRVLTKFASELTKTDEIALSMNFVNQIKNGTFVSIEQTVLEYIENKRMLSI